MLAAVAATASACSSTARSSSASTLVVLVTDAAGPAADSVLEFGYRPGSFPRHSATPGPEHDGRATGPVRKPPIPPRQPVSSDTRAALSALCSSFLNPHYPPPPRKGRLG